MPWAKDPPSGRFGANVGVRRQTERDQRYKAIPGDHWRIAAATFAKDCCDREIMAFRAWKGKGLPGEPVREMLIESVEKRFGAVEAMPAGGFVAIAA